MFHHSYFLLSAKWFLILITQGWVSRVDLVLWKIPKFTKSQFSRCYHFFDVSGNNFPWIAFFEIINTCDFAPILAEKFWNIPGDFYVPNQHFTLCIHYMEHYVYILSIVSKTGLILGLITIRLSDAAHHNIMKNVPFF